jgi:SAM-dependent methyltransferase
MSREELFERVQGEVAQHYGGGDRLEEKILAAVERGATIPGRITVRDLAPLDHFHTRGEAATRELVQLTNVEPGLRILDVGGGLGGAARLVANEYGCHVTVLDLTEGYVRLGAELTARVGLGDRVSFQHGSALQLPFQDGSFDRVFTQHVSMNLAAKEQVYTEAWRVLRAGGWLGIHEIVAGPAKPIHVPVPWARRLECSFLRSQRQLRSLLRDIGFDEDVWTDETGRARRWFADRLATWSSADLERSVGVHLLLGDDFEPMFRNLVRNLEEGRVQVVLAALRKDRQRRRRPGGATVTGWPTTAENR